ncbi:MAG: hypothetical protein PHP57_06965 [Sideroxydans sp.]|nr:hypothetical protein [Sideroxydans sp.]
MLKINKLGRNNTRPTAIIISSKNAQGKAESKSYSIDADAGKTDSELRNKLLLSLALEPGKYEIQSIFGTAGAFPFIATFSTPLLMELNVAPTSVTYVGRVNAIMRPRIGNEFRAGPVIPLIDQAAAGVSGSTFDISVVDAPEDLAAFKSTFPALSNTEIRTEPLPAFNRNRVQAWWNNNGSDPAPADKQAKN